MRTVGSHKMMLVGRCENIVTSKCGCTKSKVVKRKFEDQEDTERAPRCALNAAQTLCLNSGPEPAMDVPAAAAAAEDDD